MRKQVVLRITSSNNNPTQTTTTKSFCAFLAFAILLGSASNGSSLGTRFSFESQVGVVEKFENRFCLAIRNPNLGEGDRVQIISLNKPQSVAEALIVKKQSTSCSTNRDTDEKESFYSLKATKGRVELFTVSLAVVRYDGKFALNRGAVFADLNKDGRREYFRKCTSNEGIHLTVWSGRPLLGKRTWHRYFYLTYDVVPSCKERDYDGI
jgi:hypothetical protein